MKKRTVLAVGAALAAGVTAFELVRNSQIKTLPANTPREFHIHAHSFLRALEDNAPFDVWLLDDSFLFIDRRYDCSDFLANSLLRAVYAYEDKLDGYKSGLSDRLRDLFLGFKYHWDQNGCDSLCTWSENHQILYAGLEYLAGSRYENEVFINSGKTGAYHRERGKRRVLAWCRRRFRFGFTEWYSNNYYLEDIAAMSNIQELAPDAEVRQAMTQVLHIILFDMATQSFRGSFVSTGGRMYENNKKSARKGCQLNRVIAHAFGMEVIDEAVPLHEELTFMTRDMDLNFLLNKLYKTPEVLKRIARDTSPRVIRASNSVDIDEGVEMGLFGRSDEQLAAQWEMEAFSNHQVLPYTMAGLSRNNMLCSEFFAPMKMLDLTVLKPFYGVLSRALNPATDGKVTQRANTYTYRTPYTMLASAQAYQPGGFSDQQHIWSCVLSDDVCVFATHPSGELEEKGALSKSPGYWVGNGRNPHAAQWENTLLAIYHLPKKKAVFERGLYPFTHAYFPFEKFDEVRITPCFAFGRLGGAYVALVSATPFIRSGADELKQYGAKQFWLCVCSSEAEETFDEFTRRISAQKPCFDGEKLTFGNLELAYKKGFTVDGKRVDMQFKRYDSDYCVAERDADSFAYEFDGQRLEVSV